MFTFVLIGNVITMAILQWALWPKGEPEPADWTLSVADPLPITSGAPGLSGFSPTPLYYDNIRVTRNN